MIIYTCTCLHIDMLCLRQLRAAAEAELSRGRVAHLAQDADNDNNDNSVYKGTNNTIYIHILI